MSTLSQETELLVSPAIDHFEPSKSLEDEGGSSLPDSARGTTKLLPINIFYCYAYEDEDLRNRIDNHLGILKRTGQIVSWHKGDIQAGMDREREIEKNLSIADIVLLLVSRNFVNSNDCYDREMPKAMELQKEGKSAV